MVTGRPTSMPRPLVLAVALVAALAAATLATGVARAAVISFTFELTAAEEVPTPGPEGATGTARISIDDETNEVCYELTVDGIAADDAVVAAHIHAGAAGVAGDVVVPLFTEPPSGDMAGCVAEVDPSVVAAIIDDPAGFYVNIHTEAFPGGAVRGQMVVSGVSEDCDITVEPATVAEGGQVVVSGNFGANAEIHLVPGTSGSFPEDSEPVVTIPVDQATFSVTLTIQHGSVGTWTVWGFIPATECGDTATLTVTAATVPDTATSADLPSPVAALGAMLVVLAGSAVERRLRTVRPR